MKKLLFVLPIVLLLAAGCNAGQQAIVQTQQLNQERNISVPQNQSPSLDIKNKVPDIILPTGYLGTRYSVALGVSGVTRENLGTVVDSKKLPNGLSLELTEIPCAPQASQCPPQPYLIGTPTSSGNYRFVITTSSAKVNYILQIK